MPDISKLREESRTAGAKILALETKIIALQQQSGSVLLNKGSGSDEFQKIVKELRQCDEDLKDAKILNAAITQAIREAQREIRRKESAEILKRNKEILQKYAKPKCPKCGTSTAVNLVTIHPSDNCLQPVDTPALSSLDFQCDNCGLGRRFSLSFAEDGKPLPPGIQKSEMKGILGKIEETAKKVASAATSLL